MTVIMASMTLGPAIYTCVKCRAEWEVTLIALSQLTPWSFKIMNDGVRANDDNNDDYHTNKKYIKCGKYITFLLLSLAGWLLGITVLVIKLIKMNSDKAFIWAWIMYGVGVTALVMYSVETIPKRDYSLL